MVKRFFILVAVLALMLAAAVPAALAQEQASATGVLRAGLPADVGGFGTHSIEDEASGTLYALRSAGADLDSYVGQQVTVYGALMPGKEGSGEGGFGGSGTLPSIDVVRVEPGGPGGPPPGPPPAERSATFAFELETECEPPADATFFGNVRMGEGGPGSFVPLLDPDGDGTYTGATVVDRFGPGPGPAAGAEPLSFPVQIVQGTGTQGLRPEGPLEVVKDFGPVKVEDRTFEASASFCGSDGGSDDGGSGNDGSGDGSGNGSGSASASGSDSAGGGSGAKVLPATGGGATLFALGAGALLVVGGLLVRRITR